MQTRNHSKWTVERKKQETYSVEEHSNMLIWIGSVQMEKGTKMTEYINKAKLKAKIDALHPSVYDETPEWNDGYYSAMNDIEAETTVLPTIDIVHCKDCKYWQVGVMDLGLDCHTYPDHFCAEGERKE